MPRLPLVAFVVLDAATRSRTEISTAVYVVTSCRWTMAELSAGLLRGLPGMLLAGGLGVSQIDSAYDFGQRLINSPVCDVT